VRLVNRTRARPPPRKTRAADFDRAVAEFFMRIALDEAKKGVGRTSPNPAVGAILVKGGRVLARGWHKKAGTPHAEVVAIEGAGPRARGADLYSTLEPCDHFGRTPPCTQAILDAGVRRVFFASSDPNPLVNGRGLKRLSRAGVFVRGGVLAAEADRLNRPFFKLIREGRPFVTLKAAVTLDGKLATATGDSRWVTGEKARAKVHELRDQVDAVLVGANTVERDDPRLTTRLPRGGGRDPMRVVVDSHLRTSSKRKLFSSKSKARVVVATLEAETSAKAKKLIAAGAEVWRLPARGGKVDLSALLARLAKEGCAHLLVEGGAQVFEELLKRRLADELWLFVAPKLVGSTGLSWAGDLGVRAMQRALTVKGFGYELYGDDLLIRAGL
jgi:diaminohydroxyphosphoribosylaminopyrimidine deaminase/5-amino-6-(5-phosphoribosylamino)uracil reductase